MMNLLFIYFLSKYALFLQQKTPVSLLLRTNTVYKMGDQKTFKKTDTLIAYLWLEVDVD